MIVDTHTQLGDSGISGWKVTHEDLVHAREAHGVDPSLVITHAVTEDNRQAHDIAAACVRDDRSIQRFLGA